MSNHPAGTPGYPPVPRVTGFLAALSVLVSGKQEILVTFLESSRFALFGDVFGFIKFVVDQKL